MKLLQAITTLLAVSIASVYASGGEANNEITYYGCPRECSAQRNPSCPQFDDDNLPSHFAAISTGLDNYESYCGHFAIYMMSDGSNNILGKATIVDSCSSCASKHLDLSLTAFKEVREQSKGTGKVIWGIYSKSGSKLAGPFSSDVSGAAKKNGMSSDSFIDAFNENAKSLASSGSSTRSFNGSNSGSDNKKTTTSKKTTSSTTSRTTTRTTTKTLPRPVNNNTTKAPVSTVKSLPVKSAPVKTLPSKTVPGKTLPIGTTTKQINTTINPTTTVGVGAFTTSIANAPKAQPTKSIDQIIIEDKPKDDSKIGTTVGLLALGGGCLGAAGVGLVLLKKKNPSTYEDIKQKFPEAFSNVKRGLSRRATSIKRRVTKRAPKPTADAENV